MLVSIDHRLALLAPGHHRDDFFGKEAGLLSRSSTLRAAQREGVLSGATYLPLIGHVVSSLRHGMHAIHFLHIRIDEEPDHGGVLNLLGASERRFSLAHTVGR